MASHLLLLLTLFTFFSHSLALSQDGTFLLAFRYNILSDPLSQLQNWNYSDPSPCSWTGVTCDPTRTRVTSLVLAGAQLLGSVAPQLGLLDNLQHLDLSNNFFNGTLPETLFNSSHLQSLNLCNNVISGEIPATIRLESPLSYLNLSENALSGLIPRNLSNLKNLTVVSLKGNYFSGGLPRGFGSVEALDLSSNLFNGSLPSDVGGKGLAYLNLSNNKLSGEFPPEFGTQWPENATIDLSYNNLTGQIPDAKSLVGQKSDAFAGNPDLCGKPLKETCVIPSTLSTPPNVSSISPAIAVIPRSLDSGHSSGKSSSSAPVGGGSPAGMNPMAIVGITLADLAGIGLLALALFYLYQWRKKRAENNTPEKNAAHHHNHQVSAHFTATPSPPATTACCCMKAPETEATTTEGRTSSDSENSGAEEIDGQEAVNAGVATGKLVMLDGETEMDMETLMKASAYILGASGSSIVYKAVLQDGTTFAVRRLGEAGAGGERLRKENFEIQVRAVAKLKHLNVARVRGFFWGSTEKLVISDYVSNGSLASISGYRKNGSSSPCHVSLEARLKIARGVARGLIYIHDKKFVHGNLKPSNILLTHEMEPIIGDLGINWIIHGYKGSGSGRQFGSKRAMAQYDMGHDLSVSGSPYISPLGFANGPTSPYQAPELLKSLKASPKWDVYSFGVILLELLTGKVFLDRELGQSSTPSSGIEDKYWALQMADGAIRADVQGREEAVVGVFKLGFQCASMVPHKRPSMKEALQVLEKVPVSSWQMMI